MLTERDEAMKRVKWQLQEYEESQAIAPAVIEKLIETRELNAFFQPIFSSQTGQVYGYEALARVGAAFAKRCGQESFNIADLFESARRAHLLSSLDMACRENAFRRAAELGFREHAFYLFINVCPETLMDPEHTFGVSDLLAEVWSLSKEKIIFEITEETAVHDYDLFCRALSYYRNQGYKIAIDDFGVGYGGLKMLAMIEPEFVKIDRHFVSNINSALVRLNLVESIATACHRMGIRVIAEGIENQDDLRIINNMGIELLQGFHLGRPAPALLNHSERIEVAARVVAGRTVLGSRARATDDHAQGGQMPPVSSEEVSFIGEIARPQNPVAPNASLPEVRARFLAQPEAMSLPVVDEGRVLGMLHRRRFFEQLLQGRHGYGEALNLRKNAAELVATTAFLIIESSNTLEETAQRVQARPFDALYDDVCVTGNGKYLGTVAINVLLQAITQRSLNLARSSNPLSGLPGNETIQREIERCITQNMHFDVCYVDIDNFKPFNDNYGFERGDVVIKALARLLERSLLESATSDFGFAGHIGGDDFLLIIRPQDSMPITKTVIDHFHAHLPKFHGEADCNRGCYIAKNRKGEDECFDLLSLSIGIVSTEVHRYSSFAELSSIATEVKHAAKSHRGDAVCRDRRLSDTN